MADDLVILVPVLGRPENVDPLLASIEDTVPDTHVLFLCSVPDSPEIEKLDETKYSGKYDLTVDYRIVDWLPTAGPGDYAKKINYGYAHTDEPYLFLGADDLRFHPGWWEAVQRQFAILPDVGVVGTNDLGNRRVQRGEHSTHSVVSRRYVEEYGTIDEAGKVLHDGYPHEFVDDEFVETAKFRNAFIVALDAKVEHLHPLWGKAEWGGLYLEHARRMRAGRRVYLNRKQLWMSGSR